MAKLTLLKSWTACGLTHVTAQGTLGTAPKIVIYACSLEETFKLLVPGDWA